MAIAQTYRLHAAKDQEDSLAAALQDLATAVRQIEGNLDVTILHQTATPGRFLFLEFWNSEADRKAAGAKLPKDVMGRIMASVGEPPEVVGFDVVDY